MHQAGWERVANSLLSGVIVSSPSVLVFVPLTWRLEDFLENDDSGKIRS